MIKSQLLVQPDKLSFPKWIGDTFKDYKLSPEGESIIKGNLIH